MSKSTPDLHHVLALVLVLWALVRLVRGSVQLLKDECLPNVDQWATYLSDEDRDAQSINVFVGRSVGRSWIDGLRMVFGVHEAEHHFLVDIGRTIAHHWLKWLRFFFLPQEAACMHTTIGCMQTRTVILRARAVRIGSSTSMGTGTTALEGSSEASHGSGQRDA
ncbi:hypothetical protein Hypma_016214 [Hypsizygus marmoreus]|uniref:Secreted protein n=1 Tax=Hypsizygus marmoreus TaxID=39966 RepID=A0A369J4U9_HYPMA|nr:hypothetical protein Hypma_016214 [Hypsizygus marmoreus]